MTSTDDQVTLSPQQGFSSSPLPHPPYMNLIDLDDNDDDDEPDDDCLDSIDDIQHVLQTFGNTDSSPLTIDYFDSRRFEIMYEIMNVERQFEQLKNILYDESVSLIDQKLLSIQNEEAPEYQDELKKLHEDMHVRLEIARQRRKIEIDSLENSYQAEMLSLQQTLENDKFLLYHQMQDDIQRKIDELETLKFKTHLCSNILQEMFPQEQHQQQQQQQQLISPNKKRFDSPEAQKQNIKENKKRKISFLNGSTKAVDKDNLAIFYQLSDMDIIEDWALIQSSMDQNDDDGLDDDEDDVPTNSHLPALSLRQEQYQYDENRV